MSTTRYLPFDADEVKRLNKAGWSHRRLACRYGVPLRQIQKALNPTLRWWQDTRYNRYVRPLREMSP